MRHGFVASPRGLQVLGLCQFCDLRIGVGHVANAFLAGPRSMMRLCMLCVRDGPVGCSELWECLSARSLLPVWKLQQCCSPGMDYCF